MANGPLGGFMPTPPSPGQPPQVKLETSAESRGAFNKFLGTLPSNGAVAPIQTGVMQSSVTPVSPITGNVNIFQPQMSQMAPMPMMPPAQPVQMMFDGGMVDDFGDPGISFDTSDPSIGEDVSLSSSDIAGGTFDDGDSGVSFTDDSAGGVDIVTGGQPTETPGVVDTRPRTNIRNVGPRSNLRFDPQFTADLLGRRFGDSNIAGFMSKDDFAQTRQGGASVAPVNLSTGLKTVANLTGPNQFVDPTEGIAPVTRRSGVASTGQTGSIDLLGLGDLGFGGLGLGRPNELQELGSINRDLTNRLSDLQPEVNPASIPLAPAPNLTAVDRNLTGISGIGADLSSPQSRNILDNQFTQIAGLPTIVPGAGGGFPDADPLSTDVMKAIRSGVPGIQFTNNPGALKQGQEDLTTEVIKALPDEKLASGQRLNQDFLAPAIFNTLEAGISGIDRQLGLYADNTGANITTPAALANTYLGSGNKENTPKNRAAYIDAIKAVAGESFDLNNPTTRSNISKAIANQEFGSAGAKVMDDIRGARTILDDFNLDQLRLNEPLTSNVNQLGTLDPIGQTTTVDPNLQAFNRLGPGNRLPANISFNDLTAATTPGTPQYEATRGGDLSSILTTGSPVFGTPLMERNLQQTVPNLATRTQNVSPENTAARIARNNRTINQIRADLEREKLSRVPDTALETLEGRRDRLPDQVFDIDTTSIQPFSQSAQVQKLLDRGTAAQQAKQQPEKLDRDAAALALGIGTPPLDTTNITQTALGGRQVTTTPREIDQELSPIVAAGIGAPKEFRQPFPDAGINAFGFTIPTLTSGLNALSNFSRQRVFDAVLNKGATPVYDGDVLVGAKINGVLVEGMDPNAPMDSGDNQDPITKFLRKATEDKKEEDKDDQPPNVIGGGVPTPVTKPTKPTVVKSTAPASTASFTPVGFNVGNLNDLIARITGVPTPRRMQEGGTVSAVDRFLSKVA